MAFHSGLLPDVGLRFMQHLLSGKLAAYHERQHAADLIMLEQREALIQPEGLAKGSQFSTLPLAFVKGGVQFRCRSVRSVWAKRTAAFRS